MMGARGVADQLEAHLVARLPGEVDRLAADIGPPVPDDQAGTGLDVVQLDAKPQLIRGYWTPPIDVGIDAWPFVTAVVQSMSRQRLVDLDDAGAMWLERDYPCRVFFYARGDGYQSTAAVRDRGVLAIVETFMRWQTFGYAGGNARIDPVTLIEDYSTVEISEALGATVAAGYVQFTVTALESLAPVADPLSGPIETVEVDTPVLPAHPAL